MKKDNEEAIIRQLLRRINRAGKNQSLSRSQKKMLLNEILPRQQFVFRYAPALMGVTLVAFMLVGFPVVNASKPNSFLYGVKRTIEDVRSFVQPSFNEDLIDKRDAEIEDAKNRGDDAAVIIVEKEKSEIEQRLVTDDSSNETSSSAEQEAPENESTDSTSNSANEPKTESEHQEGGGDDDRNSTTQPTNTSNQTQNRSASDTCKDALDARRRAGESVNSDLYKACDKL